MDLTEFLGARLDEDEAAIGPKTDSQADYCDDLQGVHADPERALREVAAKRALLAAHGGEHMCASGNLDGRGANSWDWFIGDCPVLVTVASIYSDHPDYLPEWAPAVT